MECNFDGLVGPTHNYAGLATGNLASQANRRQTSHPRRAALEGLAKMNALRALGVPQGFVPPHRRPNLNLLRSLGFTGDPAAVIAAARRDAPDLLAAAYSASAMWTANAATVCPSADAADERVHFTPANLVSGLHRSIETVETAAILKRIFPGGDTFAHHEPLPATTELGDEGAANHTRLVPRGGSPVQMFVFGKNEPGAHDRFPPRQTRRASEAVARMHGLTQHAVVFARQNPVAIDAGVFHHDVIGVGHADVLFVHELAFCETAEVLNDVRRAAGNGRLRISVVTADELSLVDAVGTYLFNSQIVTTDDGRVILVAPIECQTHANAAAVIQQRIADGLFDDVLFVDVRQSMANGGGPACLRLRVELTPAEMQHVAPEFWVDDDLSDRLTQWIHRHYRDSITPDDLADPDLMIQALAAIDDLDRLLGERAADIQRSR